MKHVSASEFAACARMSADPSTAIVRASAGAADLANSSGRLISYVFSDTSVGRDNHVIAANAWRLGNFMRNPVFLWAHDSDSPPIGRVVDIGARGNQLVGTVDYATRDISEFADTIFQLVKGGFLNATSTGWLPLDWKYSTDRSRPGGVDFSSVELLEISQVPVPALPTALVTARAQGIDTGPIVGWTERALDYGRTMIPREELEMMRRAAGAPKLYPAGDRGQAERAHKAQALAVSEGRSGAFESFGKFLQAVADNVARGGATDPRLIVRSPTGAGEVDPTAGGFLVPTTYEEQLIGSLYEEAVLAPLCDRRKTDKPAKVKLPAIDETSRANGSRWGGVSSYWLDEGTEPNPSLPRYRSMEFGAKKLIALSVSTEELLNDAPLLEGYVRRAFASEAAFRLDLSILAGTGVGTPLGIIGAPCAISVPKDEGQASGTITAGNITNMWSRLPAPCRKRAVWLVNEDAEGQLEQLGTASTAGMYFPAGTGGNEFALVKGRPVITVEQCPILGTPGDIVLADLSQYVLIDGGFKSALSLDVRFLAYEGVFRFVLRVDGKPIWATPVTPYNGSLTRSPFVTLAQR